MTDDFTPGAVVADFSSGGGGDQMEQWRRVVAPAVSVDIDGVGVREREDSRAM